MLYSDLLQLLRDRVRDRAQDTYLVFQEKPYSYAAIESLARRFQAALAKRGICPGDFVVLMLDNGPGFFASFFGAQMLGAIPVPISPKSTTHRIEYILDDSGAKAIMVDDHFFKNRFFDDIVTDKIKPLLLGCGEAAACEPAEQAAACHRTAFIQYTSGSTGDSKGAIISHEAVLANIEAFVKTMDFQPNTDIITSMMPLFHDMGLICFGLGSLYSGIPLYLFRQEAISLYHWLDSFGKHKATHSGGPNIFLHLANKVVRNPAKYDLSSLKMFICGSEPIFPSVVQAFEQRFSVTNVIKPAYGMAEISLCATITPVGEDYRIIDERIFSCGRPLDNVDLLILEDNGNKTNQPMVRGEVLVKTPSSMDGYLNRPEQSEQAFDDGFYKSGDEGFLDEVGNVYIVGRRKNLIIRGGEKFSPSDLEALSMEHGDVQMSGVVGVISDKNNPDEQIVLVMEVAKKVLDQEYAQRELAKKICVEAQERCRYMPDVIVYTNKGCIPVTNNGKLQHQVMRKAIEDDSFETVSKLATNKLLSR